LTIESATDEKFRNLGFGYRAPYIISSLNSIQENGGEKWLREMRDLPLEEVREKLISLKGVGRKVADCVALFSMDCPETIPVDTHVF
jgi:N-glycosylase/DNA lyase